MTQHKKRNKNLWLTEMVAIALGGMIGGGIFSILEISVSSEFLLLLMFGVLMEWERLNGLYKTSAFNDLSFVLINHRATNFETFFNNMALDAKKNQVFYQF